MPPTSPPAPHDASALEPPAAAVIGALVAEHRRFLAFLERRVGSREAAEEILQDAFVRSLDRADQLRDGESAVAWFYRLLRRALVDHWRRRDVERRALGRLAHEPTPPGPAPDAELEDVVCACVGELVATLKAEYGYAVRRVDLDGLEVRQLAEELSITPGNAAVRLHRARESLRRRVAESCGTCAEHGCLDCSCDASAKAHPHGCG